MNQIVNRILGALLDVANCEFYRERGILYMNSNGLEAELKVDGDWFFLRIDVLSQFNCNITENEFSIFMDAFQNVIENSFQANSNKFRIVDDFGEFLNIHICIRDNWLLNQPGVRNKLQQLQVLI